MRTLFILGLAAALLANVVYAAEWWETAKGAVVDAAKAEIGKAKEEAEAKTSGKLITTAETPGSFSMTNWTDGYVEVTAIATADPDIARNYSQALSLAETGARMICQRKLTEQIGGVAVNSRIVLKDEMVRNSTLVTMTQGLLVGAKEVKVKHEKLEDGSILCSMTMGVLLTTGNGVMKLGDYVAAENPNPLETYAPASFPTPDKKYTGVIIDATDCDVKPALMPNILAEDGSVVYGAQFLDSETLMNEGTSTYARAIKEAIRAGQEPLIVKAIKAIGDTACDLVLDSTVAGKLFGLEKDTGVLSKGRVVILTR